MKIHEVDKLKSREKITEPDTRVTYWGGGVGQNFDVFYTEIEKIQLSKSVPLEIQIQFETAKNTLLYSFYVYRMSTVAKLYAYAVFERALSEKIEANIDILNFSEKQKKEILKAGLRKKLELALKQGWLEKNDFFYVRDIGTVREEDLLNFIYEYFVDYRNELAHRPGNLDILWQVPTKLSIFGHLINKLFIEN